ncbi:hypothetical protein TRIP_C20361 [Candidatus Zixiibacteriota bacterium]|nr:hypothetical protein TRIP_C20361 [candidate division Zixibacteria bacterium]
MKHIEISIGTKIDKDILDNARIKMYGSRIAKGSYFETAPAPMDLWSSGTCPNSPFYLGDGTISHPVRGMVPNQIFGGRDWRR